MKIETMVLCVNRLYNNYNPETSQKIRDDKIKFLMTELAKYESYQLEKAVDGVISDENIKKFPGIAQIKNYMPRNDSHETQEFCDNCERTGYYNVWQKRESIGKWYDFAYRCACNNTTMQNIPVLASEMIPTRAHNPHPPDDTRHNEFNSKKASWDYQRLDNETFKALAYSHRMKGILKPVN